MDSPDFISIFPLSTHWNDRLIRPETLREHLLSSVIPPPLAGTKRLHDGLLALILSGGHRFLDRLAPVYVGLRVKLPESISKLQSFI